LAKEHGTAVVNLDACDALGIVLDTVPFHQPLLSAAQDLRLAIHLRSGTYASSVIQPNGQACMASRTIASSSDPASGCRATK
jgi:hypothetical protein